MNALLKDRNAGPLNCKEVEEITHNQVARMTRDSFHLGSARMKPENQEQHDDSEDEDSVARELDTSYDKQMDSLSSSRIRRKRPKVYWQIWHKAGFMLLWMALGLDTIISILGHPILGQLASAICVLMYILSNVSFRRVVCSFWFTVIDFFFR